MYEKDFLKICETFTKFILIDEGDGLGEEDGGLGIRGRGGGDFSLRIWAQQAFAGVGGHFFFRFYLRIFVPFRPLRRPVF